MMAAVWLTVLFVYATRRGNAWVWLAYGGAQAFSIVLDVYLVLLLLVHFAFVCAFLRSRTVVASFAITSVLASCAVGPFLVVAAGQVHQISWVATIGHRTIEDVTVQQYFERSPPSAVLSALLIAAAIAVWRWTSTKLVEADRQLLTLAVAWLLIPTALIVVWSALVHPIYTPRYLCFTAPAVALVLGVCIGALAARPWVAAALITLFAVAATPNYLRVQRNPYAKYGMTTARSPI
jgi:mannosyltransferase